MPERVEGPWLSVGKLIELFTAMGCTLGALPEQFDDAGETWRVRYLYSPESDDFVSLSDLADDDILPPSEIENWERRLGVRIPKGGNH